MLTIKRLGASENTTQEVRCDDNLALRADAIQGIVSDLIFGRDDVERVRVIRCPRRLGMTTAIANAINTYTGEREWGIEFIGSVDIYKSIIDNDKIKSGRDILIVDGEDVVLAAYRSASRIIIVNPLSVPVFETKILLS